MSKRTFRKYRQRAILLGRVLSLAARFPWLGIGKEVHELSERELGGLLRYSDRIGRGKP